MLFTREGHTNMCLPSESDAHNVFVLERHMEYGFNYKSTTGEV